jgi:2-polyprenyl-3-methyl-5-hydroxy-6-metoxy-1,4-benzoquinol methylase
MKIFKRIYEKNVWKSKESISGPGSTLKQTEKIRKKIPLLIKSKKIKSILDIPCGDFNWMNEIKIDKLNVNYIGADVVEELVKKNKQKYKKDNINFLKLNLTKDELPKVDLILCRDCLIHFSYKNIFFSN